MWRASCCAFGVLLAINQLADQQTKAVFLFPFFFLYFSQNLAPLYRHQGRSGWHVTKQPVKQALYFSVPVINDKMWRELELFLTHLRGVKGEKKNANFPVPLHPPSFCCTFFYLFLLPWQNRHGNAGQSWKVNKQAKLQCSWLACGSPSI